MPTPHEIHQNDLVRDHLLRVNERVPGGRPVKITADVPAYLTARVLGIATRGHLDQGCIRKEDGMKWCPFCELIEIVR